MRAGVAHVAAEQHHRAIEQSFALFACAFELGEKIAHGLHDRSFEDSQLGDLARLVAVV